MDITIERWAAFTTYPDGGNPAGVVLDARALDDATMQRIAWEVGYAETAFVGETNPDGSRQIRYFSPIAEVPFCGHATVATAIALASSAGVGEFDFESSVGRIRISVTADPGSTDLRAAFTSVEPYVEEFDAETLAETLALFGLSESDLDPRYPAQIAFAGNRHPVLTINDRARFDALGCDPATARSLMDRSGWAGTITVLHADSDDHWTARNIFPVGVISEDPATGSAAAAVGAYLRALGAVPAAGRIVIAQGAHVGRPSELTVDIPATGGIVVSGFAVPIPNEGIVTP